MASQSEERIRLKAEAALRASFPDARIIHELVVKQGSCRLDLAAVTPSRVITIEVKSERDVLTRLPDQCAQAGAVSDLFMACVTTKHLDQARELVGWLNAATEDNISSELSSRWCQRRVMQGLCNSPARLEMLWANELRVVAESGGKANRTDSIIRASEYFTGSEVRKRVCAALRARHFPRADPPIFSDLFPVETRAVA